MTDPSQRIIFLTEEITKEEMKKVLALVESVNKIVDGYFGIRPSFDIVICRGSWEMEIQCISRRPEISPEKYDDTRSTPITDCHLQEIVIRYDSAKFGHYLHELIHGVVYKGHTRQLREGLAWYFTLRLTEEYRYVRPSCQSWIDDLYIRPIRKLAHVVGDDFLKDFATGRASIEEDALSSDIQELFLPEEFFYAKGRYQ
jgi:hypothetical protein